MIEVRLFATFRHGREKIYMFPGDQFKVAGEVLEHFGILPEDVSIYLINGRHSKVNASIKDGDIIALFPPVGGG